MTPKEKALELCQKYGYLGMKWNQTKYRTLALENAKQCALIGVDEIIYVLDEYIDPVRMYWEEVKREINKL